MNWTGVGVVFPREQWRTVCRNRLELTRTGVYILVGYREGDYAPVAEIEPYGEGGKYQLILSGPPVAIGPVPFGSAPAGLMQGPRYTTLGKLLAAKVLLDLF